MTSPDSRSMSLGKRQAADSAPSLSPPPLKRKAQSSISKSAVANFFTPTSQKPKERTTWSERGPDEHSPTTLLVARYTPEEDAGGVHDRKRRKIAAFDLDSTLITSASGKKHADDAADWKWWDSSVPTRLKALYKDKRFVPHIVWDSTGRLTSSRRTANSFLLTIFTNQAGLALHPDPKTKGPKGAGKERVAAFKQKCNAVLRQLDIPLTLYAATGKDSFRKPRLGMWLELLSDHQLAESDIDLDGSYFIGDAGGRVAQMRGGSAISKDFSCSDRNFAHNVGIPYMTPEEFFLGEQPRSFSRDFDLGKYPFVDLDNQGLDGASSFQRTNPLDIVLFCGPPGAGKSTFYWKYLQPLGYERVNQDILKSREKCIQSADDLIRHGRPVAVDNTNPDVDVRAQWVDLARKHSIPIRCILFKTPAPVAEHNDAVRALNKPLNPESREGLPQVAFTSFASRYREPKAKEGFQDVLHLDFQFRGTKEEYELWGRYWL